MESHKITRASLPICGPKKASTPSQNKYFVLLGDDYIRMTWLYFLRERSKVFLFFVSRKFKNHIENQSGHRIKVLKSDRGIDYNSNEFRKFCKEEGIHHQQIVCYAPEQNGAIERKNRLP